MKRRVWYEVNVWLVKEGCPVYGPDFPTKRAAIKEAKRWKWSRVSVVRMTREEVTIR